MLTPDGIEPRANNVEAELSGDTGRATGTASATGESFERSFTWNESGFEWGKDTGFLVLKPGTMLYEWRSLDVGVFANGQRLDPVQGFGSAMPEDLRGYNDLPVLHRDAQDRMWLFFRHRVLRARDTPSFTPAHRAVWQIYGTVYSGGEWSEPVHLPFSRSRQDVRWSVANDGAGNICAAWPTEAA